MPLHWCRHSGQGALRVLWPQSIKVMDCAEALQMKKTDRADENKNVRICIISGSSFHTIVKVVIQLVYVSVII